MNVNNKGMETKYLVVDVPFNRANYPTLIGRVFDKPPAYAIVEEVSKPQN